MLPLGGVEEKLAVLDEEGGLVGMKTAIAGGVLLRKVDEEIALGGAYKAQVQWATGPERHDVEASGSG